LEPPNRPSATRLTLLQKRLDKVEKILERLEAKYANLQRWKPTDEQYVQQLVKYMECKMQGDLQVIRKNAISRSMEVAAGRKHIGLF
jgi:hypothetical protein